jgi:hypothetical protein
MLKNMTPHKITVWDSIEKNKKMAEFPSEGSIRLEQSAVETGEINGLPLFTMSFGGTVLPDIEEGKFFIVSKTIKDAYPERSDLLIVAQTTRDQNGRIDGCLGFSK